MSVRREFLVFALVGVVNSAIQYSVFLVLFRAVSTPMLLASSIGYLCGVINSYFMNRRWTFKMAHKGHGLEFGRFCVVNGLALAANLLSLKMLVEIGGLAPEIAQVLAIGISVLVNFTGNKWWTFKKERS